MGYRHISPTDFYARLQKAENLPTTAQTPPNTYFNTYHKASQRANSILCITELSKFTGMFNSAQLAIKMARMALPKVAIEVLESTTTAAGMGLVVLAATKVAASGGSLPTV